MTSISLAPPLRSLRPSPVARVTQASGFGRSAQVRTLMGWQPVANLMAGDLVLDAHGHVHELRAIRQVSVAGNNVVRMARPGRAPLVLGADQPVVVQDWRTEVLFGTSTLCPAARLVDGGKVRRGQPRGTTLFVLSFDTKVCLDLGCVQTMVSPAA